MATQERFIIESLFNIVDKDGGDVPFHLNAAQATLDNSLTGRDIIPKARQLGISAYFLARYTAKCLSKRNTRAVVISHDRESTQRMLARVHYYLDTIRGPKAVISTSSKNELTFPKTNSMFYIGTAGSRKFGRGDMITDLHCSEVAFWENPKDLITGLFQAVPRNTGEIAIESTGNGVGNYYHRTCMRAYEGKSRFRLHFLNWLQAPEYRVPMTEMERMHFMAHLNEELDEPRLIQMGLTPEQLMFRREKLDELDYDMTAFQQEYPITLDECFQSTGHSFFSIIKYEPKDSWVRIDENLYALEDHYKHRQSRYAIGVDVSAGVRRDRSVIEVIDIFSNQQVAEWVGDKIAPDRLALKVIELGKHFRDAFVTVETNNHGAVTLLKLLEGFPATESTPKVEGYPQYLLYQNNKMGGTLLDYGYKTTVSTKPILIGNLRRELVEGFKVHSPALKDELNTFVEDENGKLCATQGCFDDRVMALAVAKEGGKSAPYIYEKQIQEAKVDGKGGAFSVDSIIEELRAKHDRREGSFPIPFQDIDNARSIYH